MTEAAVKQKTVILVADDEDAILEVLCEGLKSEHYEVVVAHNGKEALQNVEQLSPDLVLLDVEMPEMTGYTVCRRMKADTVLRHIPILMLTAQSGISQKVEGLEHGADDYMTKPFEMAELLARVKTLLRRTRIGLEANPLTKMPGNVTIETEILERLRTRTPLAVLYTDLNSFKAYNDLYGFVKGDEVIRETARVLREVSASEPAFVGHIGGDDFVVLTAPEQCEALCQRIIKGFDAIAPSFYSPEDRNRGFVVTKDRRGQMTKYPLLSISIGVVTNQWRTITSLGEISKIGAEMKHFAKESEKNGSAYAIDRRRE